MVKPTSFRQTVRGFFRDYLDALSARSPVGRLVQRAAREPALRQRLLDAPRQAFAEANVKLPQGLEIQVLENTDKLIHVVLPPMASGAPSEGAAT